MRILDAFAMRSVLVAAVVATGLEIGAGVRHRGRWRRKAGGRKKERALLRDRHKDSFIRGTCEGFEDGVAGWRGRFMKYTRGQ